MRFSGENFILTPKTSQLSFVFDGISLSNSTGVAEIGFSGGGNKSTFLFSGKKIIDPNGKYVYSYGPESSVDISGDINGGDTYRYYINGELFGDGLAQSNAFTVEKFYVKSSGCFIRVGTRLGCQNIDYSVDFAPAFISNGDITGRITNNSASDFRVFYSYFSNTYPSQDVIGYVTGDVPAYSGLDFTLQDVSTSNVGSSLNSVINFRTTLGLISSSIDSQKVSGTAFNLSNFTVLRNEVFDVLPYFSGSGSVDKFYWMQYPEQKEQFFVDYQSHNESGKSAEKMLRVTLEPISPATGVHYTGVYTESFFTYFSGHDYCITGQGTSTTGIKPIWQCSGDVPGSGRYSQVPEVRFLDYSRVTGFTFNANNLFTENTPEKIPILFSGYSGELGDGASGYFLTEAFQVNIKNYLPENPSDNTPDGSNTIDWRRITGFEITNQGTGYTRMPKVFAATGFSTDQDDDAEWDNTAVGGTGYDIGRRRSPFTYKPFEAQAFGKYEAAYLTGIPNFPKNGNDYLFSGILITNPGSGYDELNYKPNIRFIRNTGDTFGTGIGDATSGEFLFNKSGYLYEFDKHWDITTGLIASGEGIRFSEKYMYDNGIYSGYYNLPAESNNVFIDVHFKNTSSNETFVAKLKISGENYAGSESLITGKNMFSIDTGLGYFPPTPSFDGANFFNISYFGS